MTLRNHISTRPWILVLIVAAVDLAVIARRIAMHARADGTGA